MSTISRRNLLQLGAMAAALNAVRLPATPRIRGGGPAEEGWQTRSYRWIQVAFTEDDPGNYDPDFWLRYFQQIRAQGACLSAGGAIAFYPTDVPFHQRSSYLGAGDSFGEMVRGCRRLGMAVIGRIDATLYADIRNLLNFRNVVNLFAETGDVRNDLNREKTIGSPEKVSGEYAALWNEAGNAGALAADKSVDLTSCTAWSSQLSCVSLRRAEARFGNGDGTFTLAEQQRTFNTFYDSFFGAWRFYAPARQVRIGFEFKF